MGMFAALIIGYAIGARAGSSNLDEIRDAIAELRKSDELADLAAAVRAHASHTLHALAGMVDPEEVRGNALDGDPDLVDEVKHIFARPEVAR
ncbi:MAG: hypothetical protein QOG65_2870 [Actinomycetota bacterium]|nr:hypothetical protein [Actinomycetota bacterium]MDQ1385491.1 hypothetical protein [Actinomycetota bacterium]